MKMTSIRAFRSSISSLTRKKEMVLVMKNGKMVGCFLPLASGENLPFELKKEFLTALGGTLAAQLAARKISEKDILNDFREFKKNRR